MNRFACFFLLLPFFAVGQSGTYHISGSFTNYSVTLLPERRFVYHFVDCTSAKSGMGKYVLGPDELVLSFEADTTCINRSMVDSIRFAAPDSDLCHLDFTIVDGQDKSPVPYCSIMLCSDSLGHGKGRRGVVSDINGHALLLLPHEKKRAYIRVSGIWHKAVTFPICPSSSYTFKVQMSDWCQPVPAGTEYRLKVKHTKKDFVIVTTKGEHFSKKK